MNEATMQYEGQRCGDFAAVAAHAGRRTVLASPHRGLATGACG